MNEQEEYRRLKKEIHIRPIFDNENLLSEIEDFGKHCHNRKRYASLKRKYKWHRIYFPKSIPIGKAYSKWLARQQSPLVSVIIPNYNHADYLQDRIDSILNQTFQNFELIILDDCSQDNSRDVILKYKDHPLVSHIVLNNQNTGNTFLQWEKGVALAKGKYIWIAESDDYADETFLDVAMAMYCLHEDCVLVRTGSYQVNERNRVLLRDWDLWEEDEAIKYYDGHDYIRHNMLHFNFIYNASMVVFRKDIFLKIDKSYQKMRSIGDWLCWIEFLEYGPICEYHRKLNYFRQHQCKVSTRSYNADKGFVDQIKVLAYIINRIKLSTFRKILLRGELYNTCISNNDEQLIQEQLKSLQENLRTSVWDYKCYRFFSVFDFLPFIPSIKNDKYK